MNTSPILLGFVDEQSIWDYLLDKREEPTVTFIPLPDTTNDR